MAGAHSRLIDHLRGNGVGADRVWIGAEHPLLEQAAIDLLRPRSSARVLELGFQSGGFAIPVILALAGHPGFTYVGVDNLAYPNAVNPGRLVSFLRSEGAMGRHVRFRLGSSTLYLRREREPFDLILLDVVKKAYPEAVRAIIERRLVRPGGHVLVHDVLDHAAAVWPTCAVLFARAGCGTLVRSDVPAGLAVVSWPEAGTGRPAPPATMVDEIRYRVSETVAMLRALRRERTGLG